ncbi:MAG: hypothetical protein DRO05_06630 [Thermoproteota archaeon]|nr:MAG: hypothetical protein DRO05_06630 [Candidatus Korarchaeota archaeon]
MENNNKLERTLKKLWQFIIKATYPPHRTYAEAVPSIIKSELEAKITVVKETGIAIRPEEIHEEVKKLTRQLDKIIFR